MKGKLLKWGVGGLVALGIFGDLTWIPTGWFLLICGIILLAGRSIMIASDKEDSKPEGDTVMLFTCLLVFVLMCWYAIDIGVKNKPPIQQRTISPEQPPTGEPVAPWPTMEDYQKMEDWSE